MATGVRHGPSPALACHLLLAEREASNDTRAPGPAAAAAAAASGSMPASSKAAEADLGLVGDPAVVRLALPARLIPAVLPRDSALVRWSVLEREMETGRDSTWAFFLRR